MAKNICLAQHSARANNTTLLHSPASHVSAVLCLLFCKYGCHNIMIDPGRTAEQYTQNKTIRYTPQGLQSPLKSLV